MPRKWQLTTLHKSKKMDSSEGPTSAAIAETANLDWARLPSKQTFSKNGYMSLQQSKYNYSNSEQKKE